MKTLEQVLSEAKWPHHNPFNENRCDSCGTDIGAEVMLFVSLETKEQNKERNALMEKLKIAVEALEWVVHPKHDEHDDYTRLACVQFRANEALEKLK